MKKWSRNWLSFCTYLFINMVVHGHQQEAPSSRELYLCLKGDNKQHTLRKDSLLYIFRCTCILITCPVAGWHIPITPTPPVSRMYSSVGGPDKPALLVIRLSFEFVSDSICQAQKDWKQILRRQRCLSGSLKFVSLFIWSFSGHFTGQTFFNSEHLWSWQQGLVWGWGAGWSKSFQ